MLGQSYRSKGIKGWNGREWKSLKLFEEKEMKRDQTHF